MPIRTFRGLIADNAQDVISLHTNNGAMGYRIVKFEIMDSLPGQQSTNHIVKIYTVEQSDSDGTVDFSDQTLLAASMERESVAAEDMPVSKTVINDRMIFNQDIYITHEDTLYAAATGKSCNYYIELEQVKLDLNQNTVATLKDIRNVTG